MSSSRSFRKIIGSIKDGTKVGIATINSDFKDLDIAIVKATSHVECPPKEKHVKTILLATSSSRPRADVAYCIYAPAKRIAKTHTWTVALKSMMVIHRLLREGDPTFRDELLNYARNRGQLLNLSSFKDDSSPSAWDYSGWVRTYALYLEERLECCHVLKYDVEAERITTNHSRTRELDTEDLLVQLPALQQLLHRLTSCHPEGAAVTNYVVQAALSMCLKESFKLYRAINDGIINLVDKIVCSYMFNCKEIESPVDLSYDSDVAIQFFEMTRPNAVKALEIYKRAMLQGARLSEFFEMCHGLDFARNFQFPVLEQSPKSFVYTMEVYVRDAPRNTEEYDERHPKSMAAVSPRTSISTGSDGGIPPAQPMPAEFFQSPHSAAQDLMELNEGLQTERDSFNLRLYTPVGAHSQQVTGWELALVSEASRVGSISPPSKRVSGFDKQFLNTLYDEATQRRYLLPAIISGTTANSTNPFDDLFSGAPSPISMAMMQKQQHQQAFAMPRQHLGCQEVWAPVHKTRLRQMHPSALKGPLLHHLRTRHFNLNLHNRSNNQKTIRGIHLETRTCHSTRCKVKWVCDVIIELKI